MTENAHTQSVIFQSILLILIDLILIVTLWYEVGTIIYHSHFRDVEIDTKT